MIKFAVSFSIIAGLSFLASDTAAQERVPKKFYPPGFVNEAPAGSSGEDLKNPPAAAPTAAATAQAGAAVLGSSPEQAQDVSGAEKQLPLYGEPVVGVGVILNSLDFEHTKDALTQLVEVIQRHDLAAGDVILIGASPFFETLQPIMQQLLGRGGFILPRIRIPKEYAVTKSPTWIVYLKDTRVLLEATGPLAENFNSKGEYIDIWGKRPSGEEAAVITPLPTPTSTAAAAAAVRAN